MRTETAADRTALLERVIVDAGLAGAARFRVPLAPLTSLGIGGPAEALLETGEAGKLSKLLAELEKWEIPWRVLGAGTNILVAAGGVPGLVIRLLPTEPLPEGENRLRAGAGALLCRAAQTARAQSLSGLEFGVGIPGTVGGAVVMNAGTKGGKIADILEAVVLLEPGKPPAEIPGAECGLAYRSSSLRGGKKIVLEAVFGLRTGAAQEIAAAEKAERQRRARTQPRGVSSAGCFFRNPPGERAGRLIEAAGFKGAREGGASVSSRHANFLLNDSGATAADFRAMADRIREGVLRSSGIRLEPEVEFWP